MRLSVVWVAWVAAGCAAPAQRWVYCPYDFREDKNVDKAAAIFARAAKAGYDTVLLEDPSFGCLPLMNERYFANLERVKRAAAEHRLDLVPALFQIGHSENLLAQDPNLAEGLPV